MKNQYFGDNRDLFKYDLILHIMRAGLVEHFTFIPMLTGTDSTGYGGKYNRDKARAGAKNGELVSFLDECVREEKRDIKQLGGFFGRYGIRMKICDRDFSHRQRQEYFEQIGDELLLRSLVFVDPDIGLEVKRTRDKHIKYSEVISLCKQMDNSSVLMIFQFIPHEVRETYFGRISGKLKEEAEDLPIYTIYISDNQISFFFLTKNKSLEDLLSKVITEYGKIYEDKGVFSRC